MWGFIHCSGWNLLCTVRLISRLTVPAALAAVHVYSPVSLGWMKAICREPELTARWRTDWPSGWPSLYHVTEGGGEPSAWHCSVTEESTGARYFLVSELMVGGTTGQSVNRNTMFAKLVFQSELQYHTSENYFTVHCPELKTMLYYMLSDLPWTLSLVFPSAVPAGFWATQMYVPESRTEALEICRLPLGKTVKLPPSFIK